MIYQGGRVDGAHFSDARGDIQVVRVKKGKHGASFALVIWGHDPDHVDKGDEAAVRAASENPLRDWVDLGKGYPYLAPVWLWSLPEVRP